MSDADFPNSIEEQELHYPADRGERPGPQIRTVAETWLLQVSLKTPRGALINVRAIDITELEGNLNAITALADVILNAEAALSAPAPGSSVPPALNQLGAQPVAQYPQQGPPPSFVPQQQAPQGAAPFCQHNQPARYVAGGVSQKTGRPYRAFWACAQPRGQECQFRQAA